MPTLQKTMEKSEYFKEIAEEVKKSRKENQNNGKFSDDFNAGRKHAFRDVLRLLHPSAADIFEKEMYETSELFNFVQLDIKDLQDRLAKARKIYVLQSKTIAELSQLTID